MGSSEAIRAVNATTSWAMGAPGNHTGIGQPSVRTKTIAAASTPSGTIR